MKSLPCYQMEFSIHELANATGMTPRQVEKWGKDGRNMSCIAETNAARLYQFTHVGGNSPIDGKIESILIGEMKKISVRCMSSHVRFQRSENQGKGRYCTRSDLREAIQAVDFHIVVDIWNFPNVRYVAIPRSQVMTLFEQRSVTPSGVDRRNFYNMFNLKFAAWEPAPLIRQNRALQNL